MLRVGIPDYRLPAERLDREIQYLLDHGISVETQVRFGEDLTLSDLQSRGFAAVFLSIGAHNSLHMRIPGEDQAEEVLDAVQFLRDVNLGVRKAPGKEIIVIGGGNVAIDAARVAKRLGAQNVTIVYRRSEQEMPAYPEEIEGAKQEGIQISLLTAPVAIQSRDGHVSGCTCIRTELGPADASGRRRPVPIKGSEFELTCDAVIPAIGQKVDLDWAVKVPGLQLTSRNTIKVNYETMQTSLPHVFAAGDAVTGPATVVEAIAAGHHGCDFDGARTANRPG
jgi:heterodisulfide reductase subunit A